MEEICECFNCGFVVSSITKSSSSSMSQFVTLDIMLIGGKNISILIKVSYRCLGEQFIETLNSWEKVRATESMDSGTFNSWKSSQERKNLLM